MTRCKAGRVSATQNWVLPWLRAPVIRCGRVGSPGDSQRSGADPLGWVVLPGQDSAGQVSPLILAPRREGGERQSIACD